LFKALVPFAIGLIWLFVVTTLAGFLPTSIPVPDIILIMAVMFSFHYPFSLGGGLSFGLGLIQDVLSGGVIGLNALSKTVIFSLSRWIARRFYLSTAASKIAMVFLCGIIDGFLMTLVLLIGGMIHVTFAILARQIILQTFFTVLFSPLIMVTTPSVSDFGERVREDEFFYGHKKARVRRI
jgi:rod shape-determining protein MreD